MEFLDGPWQSAFAFEVPGPLLSKSNFRRGGVSAGFSWQSLSRFEQSVAAVARQARPVSWAAPEAGVSLSQRSPVVSVIVARSLLDVGNFHKSLLDACEGVLFVSDAEVRAVLAVGDRARSDQWAWAGFAQCAPGAGVAELSAAVSALSACVQAASPVGSS